MGTESGGVVHTRGGNAEGRDVRAAKGGNVGTAKPESINVFSKRYLQYFLVRKARMRILIGVVYAVVDIAAKHFLVHNSSWIKSWIKNHKGMMKNVWHFAEYCGSNQRGKHSRNAHQESQEKGTLLVPQLAQSLSVVAAPKNLTMVLMLPNLWVVIFFLVYSTQAVAWRFATPLPEAEWTAANSFFHWGDPPPPRAAMLIFLRKKWHFWYFFHRHEQMWREGMCSNLRVTPKIWGVGEIIAPKGLRSSQLKQLGAQLQGFLW